MNCCGLKLAVTLELQQKPLLGASTMEIPRVLCPKGIREYSLHVCVRAAVENSMWATKYLHYFSFLQFVYSVPKNIVANLLPWVFPHVKRQLAQESTCTAGIGAILSFSFVCPLVHQCCSDMLLIILPKILQHLFLLNPCTPSPAHHR
ncbi:hypothetical protein V6N13_073237 [Hibiscus sabdariffa]